MADKKISALTAATTPLAGTEVLPIVQSSSTVKVAISDVTAGRTVAVKNLTTSLADSNDIVKLERTGSAAGSGFIFANSGQMFGVHDGTRYPFLVAQGAGTSSLEVDSSSNVNFGNGNLVQGTAAKGVNFTANTPAAGMTSQLLNWYEEGTWTPAITFGGAAVGVTYGTRVGRYTRIGNVVSFVFNLTLTSKGSSTGAAVITGLPFTSNATGQSAVTVGYFADLSGLTGAPCARIGASSTSVVISQTAAATAADLFDTHYTNTTFLIVSGQYTV